MPNPSTSPAVVTSDAAAGAGCRADHAALAWLHGLADLPRPVSLLLCDALAEWAFLARSEPVPRPPLGPAPEPAQILAGIAGRLAAALPGSKDVATALGLARIARLLLEAERALPPAGTCAGRRPAAG